MKSIAMFNNKGGVGKTTLTCNLAAYLALSKNKKVLVVDCDPQCNATQLIKGEDFAADFYWGESGTTEITTIRDILGPIEDGDSRISSRINPINRNTNRFYVDLIPGHPGFSMVEDRLSSSWHDLLSGDIGGIRKTNWNSDLCERLNETYDIIFFDLGPSLGSINRSVMIGCDYFITPMGADIFSILGIRNIFNWIQHWFGLYENSIKLAEERSPGKLEKFKIKKSPNIVSGYLGYTMQQYITKTRQGERRPTKAYEKIITSVPDVIEDTLGPFFAKKVSARTAKLGDIPHLYSLIPLAQSVSTPILDLQSKDGLVGAQYKQREDYIELIAKIGNNLLNTVEES